MNAVWMVAGAEFRSRWRSWLALALLVAAAAGLVLAAASAGWRTASAFPRFLSQHGYDSFVYANQPIDVSKLPEVTSALTMAGPANGTPECGCPLTANTFGLIEVPTAALRHFAKLVSGRWANPGSVGEVVASYTMQHDLGLHLGSEIKVPLFSVDQASSLQGDANPAPAGPVVTVRIVGFEAAEQDFPSVGTPNYDVLLTPAFGRAFNTKTFLFYAYAVTLKGGKTDIARFDHDARAIGAVGNGNQAVRVTVSSAIHPQAVGWWVLAVFIGLAGAAAVGQALRRQAIAETPTSRTLWALGLGPAEVRGVALVRTLAIGLAGGLGAAVVAVALSPLAPLGEARVADPATGLVVDLPLLALGLVATLVLVTLLSLVASGFSRSAFRPARAAEAPRPSRVVDLLTALRLPTSAVIGIRRAVERGHGEETVPVGNALAGTALAVAALCGTAVFGASLSHLVATPRLYGQAFQLWFNPHANGPDAASPIVDALHRDPAVRRITLGVAGAVAINGVSTDAIGGKPVAGTMLVSSVQGRLPTAPDEVALGFKTLQEVHARLGTDVRVEVPLPEGGIQTLTARVVGIAAFPPDFGVVGLNRGAIFSLDGIVAAQCGAGPGAQTCADQVRQQLNYVVLAGFTPDAAGRAAVVRYAAQFPDIANLPRTPTNLVNFGEAVNFPLILGLVVALFSAATVVHVLVVSVARRRREVGLLKALGFRSHQVVAAVSWQAVTVAVVGIVVGVPLGIAAGRLVWSAFATNLGVVAVPVVPVITLVILCVAVVVGANLLAVGPALVSARARPASILRSE